MVAREIRSMSLKPVYLTSPLYDPETKNPIMKNNNNETDPLKNIKILDFG